jgi:hypothetical protein
MLGNFTEVISSLEQQKEAIDKAIVALREFEGEAVVEQATPKGAVTKKAAKKKRTMSEEGRKRIGEASRKRWAAVHRAAKKAAKKAV